MQKVAKYISIVVLALAFVACNNDKTKPGYTFMDDMYISPAIETYSKTDLFPNGRGAQLPVTGTIARGYVPYNFEDTPEGYELAKVGLLLPEAYKSEQALADGKELYTIFCNHCHGPKGDGNGHLVEIGKFPAVPDYKTRDITAGSIYHVIMYGKNLMGSHASQLSDDERWKVVRYVQELRGDVVTETVAADAEVAPVVTETNDQQS